MSVEKTNGPTGPSAVIYQFRPRDPATVARPQSGGADAAAFTADARRLGKAAPIVESSADVRTERVRELKTAIADGTYEADDRAVARKLLATVL